MCFPAFPIVCDAQEPFADHLVIERKVLLITAVKIVETGLPGIVPAIVQVLEREIEGEGTCIQQRRDSSGRTRFPPNRPFSKSRVYRGRTFQPNRCLPEKGEAIGVLFSYL